MRLTNHIARRFLTDVTMLDEIMDNMVPGGMDLAARVLKTKEKEIEKGTGDVTYELDTQADKDKLSKTVNLFSLISANEQRAYWITDSVFDKLDLLKVKPDSKKEYDWRFFNSIPDYTKKTFILPPNKDWTGGGVWRIFMHRGVLQVYAGYMKHVDVKNNKGQALHITFHIDTKTNEHCSEFHTNKDIENLNESIYKLMCFIFLSENTEEILAPNASKGTKKSGKFKNDLDIPLIFISSKWNITSIRTEGFDVSGHFRLQPYKAGAKMIFIEPFKKHGYKRTAKSIIDENT